ncbi:MAG: glycosyltransferase [Pseudomonadota bacterium]
MKIGVIVSTYNSPRYLDLTLTALAGQERPADEILIADDGSGPETGDVIEAWANKGLPVQRIWHADNGFQKTIAVNRAIAASASEYLLFTDGDTLHCPWYIGLSQRLARPGRYLCGSLLRLSEAASANVTREKVTTKQVFDARYLRDVGLVTGVTSWLKTAPLPGALTRGLDAIWPIRKTFNGANASCWRDDALRVNGFDNDMRYGGLDKEFGVRLQNAGVRGRHIRFSAPVLHLDHGRPYADPEIRRVNRGKIAKARREKIVRTENGLAELALL